MEDIKVNDIVAKVKADIEAKGFTDSDIKFDEIVIPSVTMGSPFDFGIFKDKVSATHEIKNVNSCKDLQGNKIATTFKKILRRMMSFYIEPTVESQNEVNSALVEQMTMLCNKIEGDNYRFNELEKKIFRLERKCQSLEWENAALKEKLGLDKNEA